MSSKQEFLSYRDRADQAFPTDQKESADAYLEKLHEAWATLGASIRRTVLLIVIAITIFALLIVSAVEEEVGLGPIKVKDLVLVQKFVPVIIAYLFYELLLELIRWNRMELGL